MPSLTTCQRPFPTPMPFLQKVAQPVQTICISLRPATGSWESVMGRKCFHCWVTRSPNLNKMKNYKPYLLVFSFFGASIINNTFAVNPLIMDQFTADPTARVFEGKVYLDR